MNSSAQWHPFDVQSSLDPKSIRIYPRPIETLQGVGDRLRAAAFAEIQARDAFLWAAAEMGDAPTELKRAWISLARAEQKHLNWLLQRMMGLCIPVKDRKVSDRLWHSLVSCKTAREFALFMASAEERGRKAGERFHLALRETDPVTAELFRKIALEEAAHIELAKKYFPGPT